MSKSEVCDGLKQSEFENDSIHLPSKKKCIQCGELKDLLDYYSKGNRRDSICKSCVLDKKRRSRKKKRQLRERRRVTKVLDVQNLMIQDIVLEKPETSLENFDTTLTNYVLDVAIAFKSEEPNE